MMKIIIQLILLFIPIIFVGSFSYYIWEEISIRNLVAKNLNYLMDIDYYGTYNDIRRNYDMFCSFAFYVKDNYINESNKNKKIHISFKPKDNLIDKEELCRKYLKLADKKENIYNFLEENFIISVNFLE